MRVYGRFDSAGSIDLSFYLGFTYTQNIKGAWHLRLEKSDIPKTQIDDEVGVVGEDRLQLNF